MALTSIIKTNLKPIEFCSDMFLLPLGYTNTVDYLDLSTNEYIKCPRPDPPPRSSGTNGDSQKDSYLNNMIDIKNPLLNTLTLKNQLDQKEQSYYEILINKLEFNNNEYVSKILSTNPGTDEFPDSNELHNVCSSVQKIVTSSSTVQNISSNDIEPPVVPPPPLLSSFLSDDLDLSTNLKNVNVLSILPPPAPETPKRTHYLEPIVESLEYERNF